MRWTKYTIKTTTKDSDMISAILMDHDIVDVQIENNVQLTDEELNQMYADFVKELPPDDGRCDVSFYVEFSDEGPSAEEMEQKLKELQTDLDEAVELFGIEPTELICEDLNSDDWENNWKEFFKPFSVDRILIAPTWEEIPEDLTTVRTVDEVKTFVHMDKTEEEPNPDTTEKDAAHKGEANPPAPDIVIRIDPGMAFGTGTHETTRLCLRALQTYMKEGDSVLDLGCGSGILGIAARKLGAERIVSVDIDEQAVKVAEENFALNETGDENSLFFTGNVTNDEDLIQRIRAASGEDLYDVVTVNILADVIKVMMPGLDRYLKSGGVLITSGILSEKEQMIREAVADNPNLSLCEVKTDGDWVSVIAKRR